MPGPIQSLVATGTKVWLDSVDPTLIERFMPLGVSGATSNPIIIADLIATGRFDERISKALQGDMNDSEIAWELTDELVCHAQQVFSEVYERTGGDDGYVSFELDPLLEDPEQGPPHADRVRQYTQLGLRWSAKHHNRLMKVPATKAGIEALEHLSAAGVKLNVTLIFSANQYRAARDAVLRGASRLADRSRYKSVYSIFVSRLDAYVSKNYPRLSETARQTVGILNARRLWLENQQAWQGRGFPLRQEIIFASTGTKDPKLPPDLYVAALAGSDIQTNPPGTLDAMLKLNHSYQAALDQMPPQAVIDEIDREVDFDQLERDLVAEGVKKFAEPQKTLLASVADKRRQLQNA